MELLKSSNYNNKEVILFLKDSFSAMESAECTFNNTQDFVELDLHASFSNGEYSVTLTNLFNQVTGKYDLCTKKFKTRTESIKYILFHLGIISEKELKK